MPSPDEPPTIDPPIAGGDRWILDIMRRSSLAAAVAASAALLVGSTAFAGPAARSVTTLVPTPVGLPGEMAGDLLAATGLEHARFLRISGVPATAQAMSLEMDVDGRPATVELARSSVRSANYEVLVDDGNGVLMPVEPGPVNTFRGGILGWENTVVVGGIVESELFLTIDLDDGRRIHLEPAADRVKGAPADTYLMYEDHDLLPHDGRCGVEHVGGAGAVAAAGAPDENPLAGGQLFIAELACDADWEFFQDYGSVAAVEARVNLVINTVNNQYESAVDISHEISAIVVRTSPSDPYTSSDAITRLCQFITEWTNNQQSVQRDVAHLFTGVNINGGTIGIAADIGNSGICVNQGACSGGPFGPLGSYCLSQSDFNGNFASATDLTAHELGHLWGAFHCSCPSFTMNSFITSANQFTAGSINSIVAYRNTRACLDDGGGPAPPTNDGCASATLLQANDVVSVDTTAATPAPGGVDPELPAGSPSCQWDGTPSDTHSTVWYRFQATDTSVQIRTCSTTDVQDTIVALYAGNCNSLVELACSEDECGDSTYASIICFDGLTVGDSYRIMVGNPGGWTGSQPGVIELDITSPCPDIGPVAGACCFDDGSCEIMSGVDCVAMGGTFSGIGSTCAEADCQPAAGACCLPDGGCVQVTAVDNCVALGGIFLGQDSDCLECEQFKGACCLPDGTCESFTETICDLVGGTFNGAGTDCADHCIPDCPGDFDGSGEIDFSDIVQLLSVWGPCAGCPEDFDGNDDVGFSDLVNLLSFFGGCAG